MGYDVHITRKRDWFDDDGDAITAEEWLACVDADPSMRLDGFAEARTESGDVLRVESPGLAVWVGYSGHGQGGNMAWFDLTSSGNVRVKNPDAEILRKMYALSRKLSAKVQGDEGEEYDALGAQIMTADGDRREPRPWRRFWS